MSIVNVESSKHPREAIPEENIKKPRKLFRMTSK